MGNQIHEYSDELYQYRLNASSDLSPAWEALAAKTDELSSARMRTSEDVALMLQTLAKSVSASKALDIGTFTGCSALALAEAVGNSGEVITFDISDQHRSLWDHHWKDAELDDVINFIHGDAVVALQELANERSGAFDVAFIDANKAAYRVTFDLCIDLVRTGGFVIIDDTLWRGKVVDPGCTDSQISHIREFNTYVAADSRVLVTVLPIGNGLTIALKT